MKRVTRTVAPGLLLGLLGGACWQAPEAQDTELATASAELVVWTENANLVLPSTPEAFSRFGDAIDQDGATAVVGAREEDAQGSNSGAVYVFVRQAGQWTEQAKLVGADTDAADQFGASVAIAGDTLVVGARYGNPGGGNGGGAAYVFVRNAGQWTQQAKLQPAGLSSDALFGESVDVEGDTLIVGARGDDSAGNDAGAAYVYTRNGSTWTNTQVLVPPLVTSTHAIGTDVAMSGNTVAVGAGIDDEGGFNRGSTYVFVADPQGVYAFEQRLVSSNPNNTDYFGGRLSLEGDRLAIGARRADDAGYDDGAVFIFERSGGQWTETAQLLPAFEGQSEFGADVSLDGDSLAIGQQKAENGFTWQGQVHLYERNPANEWSLATKLYESAPGDYHLFGNAVSLHGGRVLAGSRAIDNTGRVVVIDGLMTNGDPCDEATQCVSGFCSDGLCCDSACDGGCDSCNASGSAGTCTLVTAGEVGTCDAYVCDGQSATCPITCADATDCAPQHYCTDGACKLIGEVGQACDEASGCSSGFCVDGVCCDAACGDGADDCQACSVAEGAAQDGICAPRSAGTVCREAAGSCDEAETCDGTAVTCPDDEAVEDGASCDDGDACTEGDSCQAGACVGADSCGEGGAAPGDEAPAAGDDGGCGCVAAGAPVRGDAPWLLLLGAALVGVRRRRW